MTYEQALQLLGESKKYWARIHPIYKAHDIAIEALEKQIPKKPVFEKDRYGTNHFYCPSCKEMLIGTFHHCDCGQKLWWSE